MLSGFLIFWVCIVSGVLGTGTQTFLAWPGQALLAVTAVLLVLGWRRVVDWVLILPALVAVGYLALRAGLSEVGYVARADYYLALGALLALGLGFMGGTRRGFRLGVYGGILGLVLLNVGVGFYHLHDPDFSLIPGYARAFPGTRIGGLYTNPNHLCSLVALTMPLLVGSVVASRGKPWKRIFFAGLALIWGVIALLTFSRAGLIGVGLSVILFLVFLARGGVKVIAVRLPWWALAGFLVVGSVGLIFGIQLLNKRSDELFDTLSQRQQMASTAFRQMQENPVVGTGAGSFRYLGNVYRSSLWKAHVQDTGSDYAHNDWIQLAAEYGLVGLLLSLGACAWFFWSLWVWLGERTMAISKGRTAAPVGAVVFAGAAGAGVASLLIHSFFDFNLHLWSHVLLSSLLMGMVLSLLGTADGRLPVEATPPSKWRWAFVGFMVALGLFHLSHGRLWRAEYLAIKGLRAEMSGEYTVSNNWLSQALEVDPENGDYLKRRAMNSLAMAFRYKEVAAVKRSYESKALADFQRLSEINPRGFEGWMHQGLVLAEMGRYAAAERQLAVALKLAPFHRVVHFGYASVLFARAVAEQDAEGVKAAHAYLTGVFPRFGSTEESLALAKMMKDYLQENKG